MAGIMNDNTILQMQYANDQEMQCEESTIDDSSIQPTIYSTPSSDWNGQQSSYSTPASYTKSHSKGSKKVKSEDTDEDIDIDNYVQLDVQRIPVKTLRKVIPKLRIAVYCSELMTSGKRKLKHLWDERPGDWPQNVPFKDPNNACKDVKKPGKDELGPMFNFLKQKYIQNQGNNHQPTATYGTDNDYSYCHQAMTESSNDKEAFYSSVSSNPILPQIHYDQQPNDHNNTFMVNPKVEPSAYVDISELMKQERHPTPFGMSSQLASLVHQGNTAQITTLSKPQPVIDLYSRLDKKNAEVIGLSPPENQTLVMDVLRKVQQAVIKKLYDDITPSDTRVCLMFLDAGHQMEALLDVMLVLRQVDLQLLDNGCQEIIKKFNTQNVNFVFLPSTQPNTKDQLLLSTGTCFKDHLTSSVSGNSESKLLQALGLDLFEPGKEKSGYDLATSDNLSNPGQLLFKPRDGVGQLEDMGIQTRPFTVPSPGSVMSISSYVCEEEKGQMSKLYQQEKLELIMRHLKDDMQMNTRELVFPSEIVNSFTNKEVMDEQMLDDISEFIEGEQYDEKPESGYDSLQSFCQETGSGFADQHSQLLPSSAMNMIPAMVEGLTCFDSENEESDNSTSAWPSRQSGGGSRGGGSRGGGEGFFTGRTFECHLNTWRSGNQL